MKKILLFLTLFLVGQMVVNAKTDTFYLSDKLDNDYVYSKENGIESHTKIEIMRSSTTNEVVYCLNPLTLMNQEGEYIGYNYNNKLFNLTDKQIDKINTIAYYGYNYLGHTDGKWYSATQMLIWKEVGIDVSYFTDGYKGEKIDKYVNEMNEITNLVNEYYKRPSYDGGSVKVSTNQYTSVQDKNKVSKYFKVIDDYDAKTTDTGLNINTNGLLGKHVINLVKESPVKKDYILYHNDTGQPLILPGRIADITAKYTFNILGGSITINKEDSEGINRHTAKIEGTKYGVYDQNDNLVNTIIINENNTGSIKDIAFGTYYVKELESYGYLLDKNTYKVVINVYELDKTLNLTDDVIKSKVIINKYNGEDLDTESCFTINGEEYKTIDGKITLDLEYGNYEVIHTCGNKEYSKIPNFNIEIKNTDNLTYNLFSNKIVTTTITTKEENITSNEEIKNTITNIVNKNETKKEKNEIITETDQQDNMIIEKVEVPNTYKNDINLTYMGILLIIIGTFIIKKVTI